MKQTFIFILLTIIIACSQPTNNKVVVEKKDTWRDSLAHELSIIMEYDQASREQGNSTAPNYDYFNLIKVKAILDKYGWLGADSIGKQGNQTLFLVIQHSDIATQRKYLPMMRKAVIDGRANGSAWALLEDRVALADCGMQIYGSQVGVDQKTLKRFIFPINDEINVNKRRANVGLEKLEDYAKSFGIEYQLPKN